MYKRYRVLHLSFSDVHTTSALIQRFKSVYLSHGEIAAVGSDLAVRARRSLKNLGLLVFRRNFSMAADNRKVGYLAVKPE